MWIGALIAQGTEDAEGMYQGSALLDEGVRFHSF